jgi:hypothetical protein
MSQLGAETKVGQEESTPTWYYDGMAAFLRAVILFAADLRDGRGFRKSLRVKKMAGYDDVWELTWAPDGRATFEYGASVKEGHPHVRWRRVGTHDIFKRP